MNVAIFVLHLLISAYLGLMLFGDWMTLRKNEKIELFDVVVEILKDAAIIYVVVLMWLGK